MTHSRGRLEMKLLWNGVYLASGMALILFAKDYTVDWIHTVVVAVVVCFAWLRGSAHEISKKPRPEEDV